MAINFVSKINVTGGGADIDGATTVTNGALKIGSVTESATNGAIYAANDVVAFATSDERLKKLP